LSNKKLSKEKRIKKEKENLKGIYKELEEDKKAIADGLLDELAFIRISLEEIKVDLLEHGFVDIMPQGDYEIRREDPASKSYIKLLQKCLQVFIVIARLGLVSPFQILQYPQPVHHAVAGFYKAVFGFCIPAQLFPKAIAKFFDQKLRHGNFQVIFVKISKRTETLPYFIKKAVCINGVTRPVATAAAYHGRAGAKKYAIGKAGCRQSLRIHINKDASEFA
jgi:hypothetical protein